MRKPAKKKYPMPQWIWDLHPHILNTQQKRFLAFIWACSDTGLRSWNYYIAKMYHVTPRTIQLWLKRLKTLEFVHVNYPSTRHRTIYRMRFFSIVDYYKYRAKMVTTIELPPPRAAKPHRAQEIAPINTPKEKNKLKSAYSSPPSEIAETPAAGEANSTASSAGRLGGSGDAKKPKLEK